MTASETRTVTEASSNERAEIVGAPTPKVGEPGYYTFLAASQDHRNQLYKN